MPSMANLTVKKADGTTDITYDAITASGGDRTPAVWRQDTGASADLPVGLRATLSLSTQWNGPKTARNANFSFVFPCAVEDSTTGLYSAKDRIPMSGNITIPQNATPAQINEAVYQLFNLLATSLVKSSVAAGYAPV